MHRRSRQHRRIEVPKAALVQAALPDEGVLRNIFSVVNEIVARAGRTTLAMALRGSRSKRVLQLGLDKCVGHGSFAGRSMDEVLAVVDQLIACDLLQVDYHDDFPLLVYGPEGLQLTMRFTAESWLEDLRLQVPIAAKGSAPRLPFIEIGLPQRNHNTVELLVAMVAKEAGPEWLPLLKVWHAAEIRRIRAGLQRIIDTL